MRGNFDSILLSDELVLVDFFASWCQPCKAQSPILSEVAQEIKGNLKIIKIDVDKNKGVALKYNVRGVPTLALFKKGNLVWRESGVQQKQKLLSVIQSFLK